MSSMPFPDMPIKWKLLLAILLVSLVALLSAGALFFVFEYSSVKSMVIRDVQSISQITAANCVGALAFDDEKAAGATLQGLAAKPEIVSACIYDKDGKVFVEYNRNERTSRLPDRPQPDGLHEGAYLDYCAPVAVKGERIGTVCLRADNSQLEAWQRQVLMLLFLIILLAGSFAFLLASILQKKFLAPIMALADTARIVTRDRVYALRARRFSNDELGQLVDQFNEMLEQVQVRDRALEDARHELELRVEQRTHELKQVNKELESFSYSVAHDLRAPLRSIDGFSLIILEDFGSSLDPGIKKYLDRIRNATQRMAQLLDDLLKLSKVTRCNLAPVEFDLALAARSILEDLQQLSPERKVRCSVDETMQVTADPGLLRNVLQNLLGNAWKFTGNNPDAQIHFGKQQKDGKDVYFIRDNGAGFDMAYRDKLFGAFQRLHSSSEFPGTGVGLATVQRIIQRHNGEIWAESEVGKGATFYFTLARA